MLHKEQAYIQEHAKRLGIPYYLVKHDTPTTTCEEKAQLLGWGPERIVRTIYLSLDDKKIAIVSPSTSRVKTKKAIMQLGYSSRQAKAFTFANDLVTGVIPGTSTPFVRRDAMKSVDHLIMMESAITELVDIGIGGETQEHLKYSMHIPYDGIYKILEKEFGEKIRWLA